MFFSCQRSSDDIPLVPPPTHPLVRNFIGYGVVNAFFTHIMDKPGREGVSQGYLRKGSLVRIIERRSLNNRGNVEFWVYIDGPDQDSESGSKGWLNESALDIYDSKARAVTASEAMSP
ncbi:MAG: hypothetical protein LBQ67_06555 [Treponema sp.]|nr:hypothetical protein [Treponema sp.]